MRKADHSSGRKFGRYSEHPFLKICKLSEVKELAQKFTIVFLLYGFETGDTLHSCRLLALDIVIYIHIRHDGILPQRSRQHHSFQCAASAEGDIYLSGCE